MQQYHTLAIANIATATQADRTSVTLLTETILGLSGQVALLTTKLATLQAENARMKKSGQQSTTSGHGHQASSNSTPSYPNPSQDQNLYSRSGQRLDPNGYCSSHRYKLEELHTSATCCFPINFHNKSATWLKIMGVKTCNKEWINGVTTDWGGAGLDKGMVYINENYINYIQSNPKLVLPIDDLAVADTGTTVHYLTLDSPCSNKQRAFHLLPIQMPNEEIIKSTYTALLSCPDLTLQAQQAHLFQGSRRPCCLLGHYAIMDVKPHSITSLSTSRTSRVEKLSWG